MENLTQIVERLTKEINHNQRLLDDYYKDKIKKTAGRLIKAVEFFNGYGGNADKYTTDCIEELTKLNNRAKEVMNKLYTLRKAREITEKQINGKVAI